MSKLRASVVGGPNGAGKTILSHFLQEIGTLNLRPINLDFLKKSALESGEMISNDPLQIEKQVEREVKKELFNRAKKAIQLKESFAYAI